MKFCQPIPQSLHYSLFFHVCFTNTMPLFSKEFCSRTSLESGDVITPPYCKKKFTTKKHWENTSKHNSKQQNKMVASRPRSPSVVAAAAVGAVCLEKRKDNEKSFCGADGGTTHHIHTPRAFLRRWIFRVCACSLVLAGRYLLVALLIVDSFCRCCSPSIKTRRRLHPNPNVAHMTHKKFPHQQQRSPPVLRLQMDVGPDES
jgi:hypothetical protein